MNFAKLSPNFSLAGLGLFLTPIPPAPTHPSTGQTRLVVKWSVVQANQIQLDVPTTSLTSLTRDYYWPLVTCNCLLLLATFYLLLAITYY